MLYRQDDIRQIASLPPYLSYPQSSNHDKPQHTSQTGNGTEAIFSIDNIRTLKCLRTLSRHGNLFSVQEAHVPCLYYFHYAWVIIILCIASIPIHLWLSIIFHTVIIGSINL